MSAHPHPTEAHKTGEAHGTRRSYLIGFLLSVALTAVPFWLVMSGPLSATWTAALVVLLAVVQIGVHTVFFLHVNPRAEGGWTLLAMVFTGVILIIVVAGSLWIMWHLHGNMMPSAPQPLVDPAAPVAVPAGSPVAR